jgi:hypothetical protein
MGNKTDEGIILGPKPNWRQLAQEYISAKQTRIETEAAEKVPGKPQSQPIEKSVPATKPVRKNIETKKPAATIPVANMGNKLTKTSRAKNNPPAQPAPALNKTGVAIRPAPLPPPPPSFAIPYQQRVENYRYDILIEIKNLPVIISTKNLLSKKTIEPGTYHARVDDDKWLVLRPDGASIADEYGLHIRQWAQYQRGHKELANVTISGEK